MTRLILWLLARLFRYRDISHEGSLYLRRYFLRGFETDSQWFLHYIPRPDKDLTPHDHPWDFTSWVLAGGYVEHVKCVLCAGMGSALPCPDTWAHERRWLSRQSVRAEFIHRIDSVKPGTWTLVHTGPKRRSWGFWTPEGFVGWRKYLGLPDDAAYSSEVVE